MLSKGTAGIACAVTAAFILFNVADATQPGLREVERRRARAEASRKQIETDALKAARTVDDLRQSLVVAAAQQRVAEEEVVRLEQAVARLENRAATVEARSSAAQARLDRAVVVLYQLDAARASGTGQAIAKVVVRESAEELQSLAADRADVAAARQDLTLRQSELAAARRDLEDRRARLSGLLALEQAREDRLNRTLVSAVARERALADQAKTLRELVRRSAARPARSQKAAATPVPRALARLAPASSTVLRRYGERTGTGAASQISHGVTLRLREGAQVLAPTNATIGYAGPFRSYGSVLILNLEGDYAVVLAGLDSLLVRSGQEVLAGQPIAEMAARESGGPATQPPELYVEVRKGGVPVDPSSLVAAGRGRIAP